MDIGARRRSRGPCGAVWMRTRGFIVMGWPQERHQGDADAGSRRPRGVVGSWTFVPGWPGLCRSCLLALLTAFGRQERGHDGDKLRRVGITVITLTFALGTAALLWCRRVALADRAERAGRPWDLMDAELIYMEKRFDVTEPVRLSTRLDRAYRKRSGLVVLVELKTRAVSRAFASDEIQLSAQKLALERTTRQVVANHGYVIVQTPDGVREAHRVQLISEEAVVALVRRRAAIVAGLISPRPAV